MRRRPAAAYRVIDEAELLGGGVAWSGDNGQLTPASAPDSEPRPRRGRRVWRSAWGSTLASVAGMAGIAAVLVASSAHAPPARVHRLGVATAGAKAHRPDRAVASGFVPHLSGRVIRPVHVPIKRERAAATPTPLSLAPPPRREAAKRRRSSPRRVGPVSAGSGPQVTAAAVTTRPVMPDATDRPALPSEQPAPAATADPAAEFGFER
jgi:hypothetical protein